MTNFRKIFILPVEEELPNLPITQEEYEDIIKERLIPRLAQEAKQEYISNYFIPTRRYNNERLILSETRLLLFLTLSLMFYINFILYFYTASPQEFSSVTENLISLFVLFLLVYSPVPLTFLLSRNHWILNIKSTNVPFIESPRDKNIREGMYAVTKEFEENNNQEAISAHLKTNPI